MKKVCLMCISVLVLSSLSISLPAFADSGGDVENAKPAIIKVFDAPVGIESNFKDGKCQIQYGVFPMNAVMVASGNSLRIKVFGDDDVIILCNGAKGITISRD